MLYNSLLSKKDDTKPRCRSNVFVGYKEAVGVKKMGVSEGNVRVQSGEEEPVMINSELASSLPCRNFVTSNHKRT